ncbi:hypothetical protein, partial [Leptospira stimsonii]|uniref:hypothetical protein n=1 Tax=Leptospira stimsonii TaxID=2202203 RepID=UPI0010823355
MSAIDRRGKKFWRINILLILLVQCSSTPIIKEPIQLKEIIGADPISIGSSKLEIELDDTLEERDSSILLQLIGDEQSNINLNSREKKFSHSFAKTIGAENIKLEMPVDEYYGYLTFYSIKRRFFLPNYRSRAKMFFGLDIPYEYQERIKKENRCIRKAGLEDIEIYYY